VSLNNCFVFPAYLSCYQSHFYSSVNQQSIFFGTFLNWATSLKLYLTSTQASQLFILSLIVLFGDAIASKDEVLSLTSCES